MTVKKMIRLIADEGMLLQKEEVVCRTADVFEDEDLTLWSEIVDPNYVAPAVRAE